MTFGRLGVELLSLEKAVERTGMDVFGAIDFNAAFLGTLALDTALVDSSIAGYRLDGQEALRVLGRIESRLRPRRRRFPSAGDAAPFTSARSSISSRPLTGATIARTPPLWSTIGASGVEQRTPDLSAVVQEIVDQFRLVERRRSGDRAERQRPTRCRRLRGRFDRGGATGRRVPHDSTRELCIARRRLGEPRGTSVPTSHRLVAAPP